jgi:hypothetical protein
MIILRKIKSCNRHQKINNYKNTVRKRLIYMWTEAHSSYLSTTYNLDPRYYRGSDVVGHVEEREVGTTPVRNGTSLGERGAGIE